MLNKVKHSVGAVLIVVGWLGADSECIWIPLALLSVGLLLIRDVLGEEA